MTVRDDQIDCVAHALRTHAEFQHRIAMRHDIDWDGLAAFAVASLDAYEERRRQNVFDPADTGTGCINGGEPQQVTLSGREYERYLDGWLNDDRETIWLEDRLRLRTPDADQPMPEWPGVQLPRKVRQQLACKHNTDHYRDDSTNLRCLDCDAFVKGNPNVPVHDGKALAFANRAIRAAAEMAHDYAAPPDWVMYRPAPRRTLRSRFKRSDRLAGHSDTVRRMMRRW